MKINKQFLIFKDRQSFERALADEAIKNTSIVFIEKERLIWTQGIMFGGESTHAKGFFLSVDDLQYGEEGDWAIVKEGDEQYIYYFRDGLWNKGDKYNEGGSPGSSCDCSSQVKNIILSQDQYDALTTYESNTIYFVLESQTQTNWTFGGTFPITFVESNGIGTFPITLQ